jgi:hypothetical protein
MESDTGATRECSVCRAILQDVGASRPPGAFGRDTGRLVENGAVFWPSTAMTGAYSGLPT